MADQETTENRTPTTTPSPPERSVTPAPARRSLGAHARVQLKRGLQMMGYDEQASLLSLAPVQRHGGGASTEQVHAAASQGIAGGGGALPHGDRIQAAFGGHDISGIKAHTGSEAKAANRAMGADAYATGDHVAFAKAPDLHTAAHEAAHIVQQQHGVSLAGGVGKSGDSYEQHADRVADAVVSGKSAEPILNQMTGGQPAGGVQKSSVQRSAVQRTGPTGSRTPTPTATPGAPAATPQQPATPTFTDMASLKSELRRLRKPLAAAAIDLYKQHDRTATDPVILGHFRADFDGAATQYENYRREMGRHQHIAALYLNWCMSKNIDNPANGPIDRFLAEAQPLHDLSHIQLTRSLLDWCVQNMANLPHPVVDVTEAQVTTTTPRPQAGTLQFELKAGVYTWGEVWIDVDEQNKPAGMSHNLHPRSAEVNDATGWPVHADLRGSFSWTFVGLSKSLELLLQRFPTQLRGHEAFDAHGDLAQDNLTHFQREYMLAKVADPSGSPATLGVKAVSKIPFGRHRMRLGATLEDFTVNITGWDGPTPNEVEVHCWVPLRQRSS